MTQMMKKKKRIYSDADYIRACKYPVEFSPEEKKHNIRLEVIAKRLEEICQIKQ